VAVKGEELAVESAAVSDAAWASLSAKVKAERMDEGSDAALVAELVVVLVVESAAVSAAVWADAK